MQIISILLIGIALSMDTFSLSLGVGTFNITNKQALKLAIIVGIMHFFMPILGMLLGNQIIKIFEVQCDILLGIILMFIAIQMLIDIIKKEEEKFNLSFIGMLLFALGVSLDSFSVGLGLRAIYDIPVVCSFVFMSSSAFFTFLGLKLGRKLNDKLGKVSTRFGGLMLFLLGLLYTLK